MSNSSQSRQEPASLNNQGLLHLYNGDYENATAIFRQALHASKHVLLMEDPHEQRNRHETSKQNENHNRISIDQFMLFRYVKNHCVDTNRRTMEQKPSICYYDKEYKEENQGFVYRHGIELPQHMPNTYESNIIYSAVIIFNLALTHHLHGIETGSSSLLLKANLLYEHAHTIQRQEDECHSILFVIAIVNNMAMIHQFLKDNLKAKMFLEHLLSVLLIIVVDTPSFSFTAGGAGHDAAADGYFRGRFLEFFFQNVSHIIFPSKNPTAPAA